MERIFHYVTSPWKYRLNGDIRILKTLRFPEELGQCHGIPLVFFDTNAILDADVLIRYVFKSRVETESEILGVICDFIEGEAKNLRQGLGIIEEIRNPNSHEYDGIYFKTQYDSYDGARRSLQDTPTPEMAEAVRVEYDRKLDSSKSVRSKETKKRGDSKFGDFSLLTVATIAASRRKRQSIIVSRDRWIKLACKALHEKFHLRLYCQDQWSFSLQEITWSGKAKKLVSEFFSADVN